MTVDLLNSNISLAIGREDSRKERLDVEVIEQRTTTWGYTKRVVKERAFIGSLIYIGETCFYQYRCFTQK